MMKLIRSLSFLFGVLLLWSEQLVSVESFSIEPIGESASAHSRLDQVRNVRNRAMASRPSSLPTGGTSGADRRLQQIRANKKASVKLATAGPTDASGADEGVQQRLDTIRMNRAATRIFAKMNEGYVNGES